MGTRLTSSWALGLAQGGWREGGGGGWTPPITIWKLVYEQINKTIVTGLLEGGLVGWRGMCLGQWVSTDFKCQTKRLDWKSMGVIFFMSQ